MPSLVTKRGKRRYLGAVMVAGKRRTKLFPDASKASMRACAAWEAKASLQMEVILTKSLTIREWANAYMTHVVRKGFCQKTFQEKRAAFKRLAAYCEVDPEAPVENISRYLCGRFFDDQIDNGRSGIAVNKDRKNLVAAWNWGKKRLEDWPNLANPFADCEKATETRAPRYVPPEEDYWAVLTDLEKEAESGDPEKMQDRCLFAAYLQVAARKSELFRLKLSDISWSSNTVRVWTRKRKGGLEYDLLPMTDELRKLLKEWVTIRFGLKTRDREYVFVSLSPLPCCEPHYGLPFKQRRHIMAKWCKRANVPHFGFHAIRHLSASILYKEGYSVAFIQKLLRHRNPNTTTKYFRSLGISEIKEGLDQALQRPGKVIPLKRVSG